MALFSNAQESNLRSCASMVEDVLASLGHDPADCRRTTEGEPAGWLVSRDAAQVAIRIHARGEASFLRMTAPIFHLDDRVDEPRLFRRLLELNAREVYGAAFALEGRRVLLTAERSTADLDRSEVLDLVRRLVAYAARFDAALVAEFGGRSAGMSSVPFLETR